jgi:hypothetical protein
MILENGIDKLSETSVNICQSMLPNIPEERRPQAKTDFGLILHGAPE